jgi:DNA repair exonuclease SbcCD ATPase subunit
MKVTLKQISDFYEKYPQYKGKLDVKTRFGYYPIEEAGVTATNSEQILITSGNRSIICSPDHKLLINGDWCKVKNIEVGMSISVDAEFNNSEKIISITKLPERVDLYDLQVAEVHEFYANGMVSHNSLILDGFCYVLFNKPFRNINKPQLINSINGREMLVELEFTSNGLYYKVIRGMKPNIFEIYCNGELLNQDAAIKDYQEILEKQIIKMNYKVFTQVVIIGAANFAVFMTLPAAQRREIIESLLDIKVFSDMMKILKLEIQDTKTKLSEINLKINSIKDRIKLKESFIKSNEEDNTLKLNSLNLKLTELTSEEVDLRHKLKLIVNEIDELTKLTERHTVVNTTITKLKVYRDKFTVDVSNFNSEIIKYKELTNCPSCEQDICDNHKTKLIESKLNKINESENVILDISNKLDLNLQELSVIKENLKLLESKNTEQNNLKRRLSTLATLITDVNSQIDELKNKDSESINRERESLKEDAKEVLELINEKQIHSDKLKIQEDSVLLLKDDGIKTSIIKKYLPILNSLINKYLASLDFFVLFEFNEQFEESIKSRYRDTFSYGSFSEGQKLRINLAIIFAWRELIKVKNSINNNLLLMDEILDSSADSEGVALLNNILFGESMKNSNIFLISHRPEWSDKFTNTIQLEMKNNFTVKKNE